MTVKGLIKKNPEGLVARAYHFAEKAHKGQKRKTGEPYFVHLNATGEILADWGLDEATIAAGLLHDTVEDTGVPLEEIGRIFSPEISFLVDGVTKLGHIKYRGAVAKVENLRKMIIALSKDLRVIFIKLADRLHNMRTLTVLPQVKQRRIALETDEIYAPIAYRLGMQQVSGELQDLAFPYLYPKEDEWLKRTIADRYEDRKHYLEEMKPVVESALKDHGITPLNIDFRAKRYSSLYHKLLKNDMDIEKIYDLVAFRIIVRSTEECYATLGIIHKLWPPLPGRIKDYIAMPKPNGYRSLHTSIIGPEQKVVEFQIRTEEMHLENEHGIAAHWLYKHAKQRKKKEAEEVEWVRQLRQWQEKYRGEETNPDEFLETMKTEFFKGRIFAITPKGEVIDLPQGSTPVDFAYQIHSEVGNSCVGARVNGKIVPLNYELRSGDLVEILTQKNKKPSSDWLVFVKSSIARDHIKAALRKQGRALVGKKTATKTELRMVVEDRIGLIKDISTVISRSHINILSFHAENKGSSSFPADKVEIGTTDSKKIEKLIVKLKSSIKEIKEISYRLM